MAGVVAAAGANVAEFKPGDEVFGSGSGTFAEYARCPAKDLALKPANVSFEQAGSVAVAGLTALQGLRDHGRLRPGQRVLINGAAGGVGTFAVQLAKVLGAEVTAVCGTRNVSLVRGIGADHVIDYTREDYTQGRGRYDLLLDIVGNHPLSACRRVLVPTGTYVMVGGPSGRWLRPLDRVLRLVPMSRLVSRR